MIMRTFSLTIILACLITSCVPGSGADAINEITKVLKDQETCWNNGDLECFMEGYWKSEDLLFIGSSGPQYGWQKTLDNYRKSYPDKATMGRLKFDIIRIDNPGLNYAHVIGKYTLTREIGDASGYFTLQWKKIDGKWVIVSDHSS